jgi:hypothetical protein
LGIRQPWLVTSHKLPFLTNDPVPLDLTLIFLQDQWLWPPPRTGTQDPTQHWAQWMDISFLCLDFAFDVFGSKPHQLVFRERNDSCFAAQNLQVNLVWSSRPSRETEKLWLYAGGSPRVVPRSAPSLSPRNLLEMQRPGPRPSCTGMETPGGPRFPLDFDFNVCHHLRVPGPHVLVLGPYWILDSLGLGGILKLESQGPHPEILTRGIWAVRCPRPGTRAF